MGTLLSCIFNFLLFNSGLDLKGKNIKLFVFFSDIITTNLAIGLANPPT